MKPLLALLLSFTLTGCVFDSTRHCPNGVRVAFASQTACQSVPTWPEISVMRLFAFGEDGLLVATVDDATAVLGSNYRLPLSLAPGTYSVVAWARLGLPVGYEVVEPVIGETTRESLILRLHHASGKLEGVDGLRLWSGAADKVSVSPNSVTDLKINLLEETNRITVEVDGFSRPNDLRVEIVTQTGSMRYSGVIVDDPEQLTLSGRRVQTETQVIDLFTLLSLGAPTRMAGRTLLITDSDDGEELFRGDLLTELLAKNPTLNTACTHDFALRFVMGELSDGTHVVMQVWVNEWLVQSYQTDV